MYDESKIIKTNSKYGQALIRKVCDLRLTPTQQQSYNKLPAGFTTTIVIYGSHQHTQQGYYNLLRDLQHCTILVLQPHNSEFTIESLQDFQTMQLWSYNHTTANSQ
jgi:hypothetical protein